MTTARDDLLVEENLTFTPLSGSFDVETVAAAIAGIGFPYRDPFEPSAFAIFSKAEARDACSEARRADPSSSFPYVLIVTVRPDEIVVYPEGKQDDLRALSLQFLEWILANYKCRIENDYGTDVSEPPPPKEVTQHETPDGSTGS